MPVHLHSLMTFFYTLIVRLIGGRKTSQATALRCPDRILVDAMDAAWLHTSDRIP